MRDYNGDGYLMFFNGKDVEKIPGAEPVGRIFYEDDKPKTILKDLKIKDIAVVGFNYDGNLDENGNFCLTFLWNKPGSNFRCKTFADIVNLQGESLLNDKTIEKVTYKGNGIYELKKAG